MAGAGTAVELGERILNPLRHLAYVRAQVNGRTALLRDQALPGKNGCISVRVLSIMRKRMEFEARGGQDFHHLWSKEPGGKSVR